MAYLHTCVGCSQAKLNCPLAAQLRDAVRSLGVSSIRHRCAARIPLYKLGDAVEVLTVAYQGAGDEDGPPPKMWFPGVFISEHGARGVAFVKPGTEADGYEFETNGRGFVKVPLSRIRPGAHEVPDMRLCGHCGDYIGLTGECGNPDARLYWPAMCSLATPARPDREVTP